MAALTGNVVLRNPESGEIEVLLEGTEIPAWADELIGDHLRATAPVVAEPTRGEGTGSDAGGPPPKVGAGSGRDAWATYAESIGLTVDPSATRGDIIAAVDTAAENAAAAAATGDAPPAA